MGTEGAFPEGYMKLILKKTLENFLKGLHLLYSTSTSNKQKKNRKERLEELLNADEVKSLTAVCDSLQACDGTLGKRPDLWQSLAFALLCVQVNMVDCC